MKSAETPLRVWRYTTEEWNRYVSFGRRDKLEFNIIYGLINAIFLSILLLFFSDFVPALDIGIGFLCATLFGILRMFFGYPYLKKNDRDAEVSIYLDRIIVNGKKFRFFKKGYGIASIKVLVKKNNFEMLELILKKARIKTYYYIPIPDGKRDEAQQIIQELNGKYDI